MTMPATDILPVVNSEIDVNQGQENSFDRAQQHVAQELASAEPEVPNETNTVELVLGEANTTNLEKLTSIMGDVGNTTDLRISVDEGIKNVLELDSSDDPLASTTNRQIAELVRRTVMVELSESGELGDYVKGNGNQQEILDSANMRAAQIASEIARGNNNLIHYAVEKSERYFGEISYFDWMPKDLDKSVVSEQNDQSVDEIRGDQRLNFAKLITSQKQDGNALQRITPDIPNFENISTFFYDNWSTLLPYNDLNNAALLPSVIQTDTMLSQGNST
jgi:hypothetical protein